MATFCGGWGLGAFIGDLDPIAKLERGELMANVAKSPVVIVLDVLNWLSNLII